jgi:type II secretory pathway pseudopilin PulG
MIEYPPVSRTVCRSPGTLRTSRAGGRRAIALAVALVTLLVVSLVAAAVMQSLVAAHRQSRQELWALQAQWLAEAGLTRGERQLARDATYTGETWLAPIIDTAEDSATTEDPATTEEIGGRDSVDGKDLFARGRVTIRVATGSPRKLIVEAFYPDSEHQRVKVRRERELDTASDGTEELP